MASFYQVNHPMFITSGRADSRARSTGSDIIWTNDDNTIIASYNPGDLSWILTCTALVFISKLLDMTRDSQNADISLSIVIPGLGYL